MPFGRILLILAALAATGVAAAQSSWHDDAGSDLTRGVTLSDAQQERVYGIEQQAWGQTRPLTQQMHRLHEQITERLLGAGDVDQTDLAPLLQQITRLREQLDQTRVAAALQIRAVMMPAQLAQAASNHAQIETLHEQERRIDQGAGK